MTNPRLCPDGSNPCGVYGYCSYCPNEPRPKVKALQCGHCGRPQHKKHRANCYMVTTHGRQRTL